MGALPRRAGLKKMRSGADSLLTVLSPHATTVAPTHTAAATAAPEPPMILLLIALLPLIALLIETPSLISELRLRRELDQPRAPLYVRGKLIRNAADLV